MSVLPDIFSISSSTEFENAALQICKYQIQHVPIYSAYCSLLKADIDHIDSISQIPFLPISFFKSHKVISSEIKQEELVFNSSGTTGQLRSKHFIAKQNYYHTSIQKSFELHYGPLSQYQFIAFLPSYMDQTNSSLIHMMEYCMKQSGSSTNCFTKNVDETKLALRESIGSERTTILIGVSYALLDLAEANITLPDSCIVMETGGMKGKRKEMIRKKFHSILKSAFSKEHIHSEYGMTELLSQSYSSGDGIFHSPPWKQVYIRDPKDYKTMLPYSKTGMVNIIDLANIYSCSFIATEDMGIKNTDGSFEIIGRSDNSEIRGCNLMYEF